MIGFVRHFRSHIKWYLLLFLILFSITLWSVILHEDRKRLKFEVLDIGQGDALFIESPSGIQVVVDGGPNNALVKELSKIMPWYDRHIDMLVVTNPDRDHLEGFIPLLQKYSVDVVLIPGTENSSEVYKNLQDKIKEKSIKEIVAKRGQIIDLGSNATLSILFPDRDVSGLSTNDGSIVMKLIYGDTSVLLTGDSPIRIEDYLLSLGDDLKSTILKAGHHGSRTSSGEEYVSAVSPKWIVASSGVDNSYGHPHKETIDTMQKLNIPFYDTCNNGSLIFESDGKKFVLKNKNPKKAIVGCKE